VTTEEDSMKNLINASLAAAAIALVPGAHAACKGCGAVVEVKLVEQKGEASGAGAVIGGVLGGVLGHQVGSGRGNDVATVAGAGAGAYAGHQIEKNKNAKTFWRVVVNMEEGKDRAFTFQNQPRYRVGDKVRVADGKLSLR